MIIKVVYEKLGGHYHCDIFTGKAMNQTFARCGTLVFDEYEWPHIRETLFKVAILKEKGHDLRAM